MSAAIQWRERLRDALAESRATGRPVFAAVLGQGLGPGDDW